MLKLIKYVREFAGTILVIVALLALQAFCDLSLPQYTSNIVNVGIQQGGVEQAAPKVIRKSQFDNLMLFVPKEDKEIVTEQYKILSKDNLSEEDYIRYVKKYPALGKEDLYLFTCKDKNIAAEISSIMAKAWLPLTSLEGDSEESLATQEKFRANLPPEMAGHDIMQILSSMSEEQLQQMMGTMSAEYSQMPDMLIEQSSITAVKAEYQSIGIDINKMQSDYILQTGIKMLMLALVAMASTIAVCFLSARVAASIGKKLRGMVFRKVVGFSNTEFDHFSTASLITRSTNDIQQVQMLLVMLFRIIFYAPIMGVGGIIKVLNTNKSMAWIIAVGVIGMLAIVLVLYTVTMPKFKIMQNLIDKLNLVTREILTGLPVIRAFSTEKYEEKRFDDANKNLTKTTLFVNRGMTFMMPLMMFIMNGISVLIVWNGAHGIDAGTMQVGDMMAFIQYTMQIIMSFLMISMMSIMLPRASVSASRIAEVLEMSEAIKEPEKIGSFERSKKGLVEFKNVSFRYPNAEEDVLSDISFIATPGQTTAIIGSTGSGKSTLVNLIPRFYDVTEGEVIIDGVDVKSVTQHDLRDKLGFVPQKGVLFSGTIDSNIRYGNIHAEAEEVQKAARIAQAADFIDEKPAKYHTEITQGGSNVSGGQKQRLAIARAIAKNPEIYVFDDSFSALDYKTDAVLRQTLKDELSESTIIIVAQRISTIINAEQILVLDEGKIVGKGTHKELLKNCDVYNQIALSQLSKEELDNE